MMILCVCMYCTLVYSVYGISVYGTSVCGTSVCGTSVYGTSAYGTSVYGTSSHRHGDKVYILVKCMALWGEQRVDIAMLCNVSWRQSLRIRV